MPFAKIKDEVTPPGGEKVCLQLYQMVSPESMAQNDAFKDKQLVMSNGTYSTVTTKGNVNGPKKAADGWYDFVIPGNNMKVVYCRHSVNHWRIYRYRKDADKQKVEKYQKKEKLIGANRGHSAIVADRDAERCVFFAGELYFETPGVLKFWTDKSGHYLCTAQGKIDPVEIAERQTKYARTADSEPLLPIKLFQPWDGEI